MASKRQLPPSSDGAGPSRPSKSLRSTHCSSENTTGLTWRELVAHVEKLQAENKKLKEKLSISQGCIDADEITSEPYDDGRYEIRILGTIKERVYRNSNVEGKDGKPLRVEILCNGNKITSGPFASAMFEIVVIQGDFCVNDYDGWSSDELERSLVNTQVQMGSSSSGTYRSKFSGGEAVLSNLKFKSSSHWAKWRLGIKLCGNIHVRVLEAISEPFKVLDHHSRVTEKPEIPLLSDGVQRLRRVGGKRAFNLKKNSICTIKDFLKLYHENKIRLLEILGINSESEKSWKIMIGHAKECHTETDTDQNARTDLDTAQQFHLIQGLSTRVQDRELVDANWISSYYDVPLSNRTDADPNDRPDHNAAQHHNTIQDQTAGVHVDAYENSSDSDGQLSDAETDAVEDQDDFFNSSLKFNLASVEKTLDGSAEACQKVINAERETMGIQHDFQQMPTSIYSQYPSPLMNEQDIIEILKSIDEEPTNISSEWSKDKARKALRLCFLFLRSCAIFGDHLVNLTKADRFNKRNKGA